MVSGLLTSPVPADGLAHGIANTLVSPQSPNERADDLNLRDP